MRISICVFFTLSIQLNTAHSQLTLEKSTNQTLPLVFQPLTKQANSILSVSPFSQKKGTHPQEFEKLEGAEIGLTEGFRYEIRDYTDPFWIGRGTAAGDYNNDGWPDIIFGANHGFILYQNVGGKFVQQQIVSDRIKKFMVYAVAFVDMNNDGWLDIFFTTFNKGNYLIINEHGTFDYNGLIRVPNKEAVLTVSPAFSDIDLDGHLDVVNGNIGLGVVTGMGHMRERRNNSITFNNKLTFHDVTLDTTSGETMASLVSDFNNDMISDIYFGNDFVAPDAILLGTGKGYHAVTGNKFLPFTPFFSMGADTGDINNDLTLDFLITGTMYMAPFVGRKPIDGKSITDYTKFKGGVETCFSISDPSFRKNCVATRSSNYISRLDNNRTITLQQCEQETDTIEKQVCQTQVMWKLITQEEKPNNCIEQYGSNQKIVEVCEILKLKGTNYEKKDLYGTIPQDDRNMLYSFDKSTSTYKMVSAFKHPGGWTWNSKIVDLDNDGWQDIVSADGTVRKSDYGWNVLMKNIDGTRFEQRQFSAGITSNFSLYSFALIDMDNDGDLDIIGNSSEGPVQVYRNFSGINNNSIAISLRDNIGNYNAIGAKITIYYKNHKQAQLREIKLSGGYMSFDPSIAYFGLGSEKNIDEIKVQWIDQSITHYIGPFKSGQHYRIERMKN